VRNMGERYWVSGAQLGMLRILVKLGKIDKVNEVLDGIEKQFLGRIEEGEKKIVAIVGYEVG